MLNIQNVFFHSHYFSKYLIIIVLCHNIYSSDSELISFKNCSVRIFKTNVEKSRGYKRLNF